ncbi:hypothetical protein [Corynebacterium caspium]|uniref:hypothetical protein n=1 Tax=Corynebacterium caspium TaxID=234828 RepID=UPI000369D4AC|nr:hypothetical protein [Corynebacterium caspium]WKD59298.1 hypothetical protein CCASP_04510 [Corynebacterium caspium DSM 44850]
MSRALYNDMHLTDDMLARVEEYLQEVDFHFPGASYKDFEINRLARYLGYMFQKEDLESFGVGLRCTKEGMRHKRTFIRMSRDQLLGKENAKRLPVNPPVLAAETLTLHRFYEPILEAQGSLPHGVDTYAKDTGLPGADMDLSMLEQQLADIVAFYNGDPVTNNQEILDLKIFWGSLLAGRYARLVYFRAAGRLNAEQELRLDRFETQTNSITSILESLELPTLETLKSKPVING